MEPWFECSGADLIAAERERQLTGEEWTSEHDDCHVKGEMALAAAVYAMPEETRDIMIFHTPLRLWIWPWRGFWKPGRAPYSHPERTDPIDQRVHELVKAGALMAAEIDRLARRRRAANSQASAD